MSIDAFFNSTAEALNNHTAALNRNSDLLQRVLAGQEAALAKLDGKPAPKATGKKDTPATEPAPAPAPAATPEPAPAAATTPSTPTVVTNDDVKAAALVWLAKIDPAGAADPKKIDKVIRGAAAEKMNGILEHFGLTGKLTGAESKLDAEQNKRAKFFIERWTAGLEVDFTADYDFDGDPTQEVEDADPLG